MQKVLVLVAAVLMSGCAAQDPSDGPAGAATGPEGAPSAPFLAQPSPLRFASGDFEGMLADEATFQPTDMCFPECSGNALQEFDLTSIVPAEAPVELAITIDGNVGAELVFTDAAPVRYETEQNGQGRQISALVTRAESGKVVLNMYGTGFFRFPPSPEPTTASFEARSVVRADRLVAYVPAAVRMEPGQHLNLTGDDIQGVVLIAPDGNVERDATEPFSVMANGTKGDYIVIMTGTSSAAVYGPNVPLAARRIEFVQGDIQQLTSGAPHTWSFAPEGRPLHVGVEIYAARTAGFLPVATVMTDYAVSITAPGNAVVVDESGSCGGPCSFGLVGGQSFFGFNSDYLDERLTPGSYDVSVMYTGNNMVASSWYMYVA